MPLNKQTLLGANPLRPLAGTATTTLSITSSQVSAYKKALSKNQTRWWVTPIISLKAWRALLWFSPRSSLWGTTSLISQTWRILAPFPIWSTSRSSPMRKTRSSYTFSRRSRRRQTNSGRASSHKEQKALTRRSLSRATTNYLGKSMINFKRKVGMENGSSKWRLREEIRARPRFLVTPTSSPSKTRQEKMRLTCKSLRKKRFWGDLEESSARSCASSNSENRSFSNLTRRAQSRVFSKGKAKHQRDSTSPKMWELRRCFWICLSQIRTSTSTRVVCLTIAHSKALYILQRELQS